MGQEIERLVVCVPLLHACIFLCSLQISKQDKSIRGTWLKNLRKRKNKLFLHKQRKVC